MASVLSIGVPARRSEALWLSPRGSTHWNAQPLLPSFWCVLEDCELALAVYLRYAQARAALEHTSGTDKRCNQGKPPYLYGQS